MTATELIAAGSSGLRHVSPPAGAAAGEAARSAGWRLVDLATTTGADKAQFMSACERAFAFPDWFGANWDALVDCLRDVDDHPGTLVLWRGCECLDQDVRRTAVDIFAERAAAGSAGAFLVLVEDADGRVVR